MGTDAEMNLESNASEFVTIHIVIDTDRVIKNCKVSLDPEKPVYITHDFGYMVAANAISCVNQGTGNLEFEAMSGDMVQMYAVSGSGNFEDEALLYNIKHHSGENVLGAFTGDLITGREIMFPADGNNPLKMQKVLYPFWSYNARIKKRGTEQYDVLFSIYTRSREGSYTLKGYYAWDPKITVKG